MEKNNKLNKSPLIESPLIESSIKKTIDLGPDDKASYTYVLIAIVIILVLFLIYHAYSCFCNNQNLDLSEPYIDGSPRTDTQSDKSFDVENEVQKLIQLQEQYLEKLQRSRMDN